MFKVQKRMCKTCIYRPDSCLDLKKLENDVADPNMKGFFRGHRVCHHSDDACCRMIRKARQRLIDLETQLEDCIEEMSQCESMFRDDEAFMQTLNDARELLKD